MNQKPGTFWDQAPIVLEPSGIPASACVVWLHGLGADGQDFVPVAQAMASNGVRHILPHAPRRPVTLNQGMVMRAWYDIALDGTRWIPNDDDLLASSRAVADILRAQMAQGMDPWRLFLAGFSQGGAVALACATHEFQQLGGVLALSTYLPMPDTLPSAGTPPLPIFMAHGTDDGVISWERGQRSQLTLQQAGYPVTWHSYPMAHSVCLEEIQDMTDWLTPLLTSRQTA